MKVIWQGSTLKSDGEIVISRDQCLFLQLKKMSEPIWFIDLNWRNDDGYESTNELNGEAPYHIRLGSEDIDQHNDEIERNTIDTILSMNKNNNFIFRIDGHQPSNPTEEDV